VRRPALRILLLVVLAVLGAACSVPGEKIASPTPETVIGPLPEQTGPAQTLPAEFADGDPAAGKNVYLGNGCGACHILKDAGTSGTIGPDLDASQPSPVLAADRIANGQGGMPAFKGTLPDKQIADVTAYIVEATRG
jgi:cytochrome c6